MEIFNLMTCQGPGWTGEIMGGCSQIWLVICLLVILDLMLRRQCEDGILSGTNFSFIGSIIIGLIAVIAIATITGSPKWVLLAGMVGIAAGGFGLGFLGIGGDGGSGE